MWTRAAGAGAWAMSCPVTQLPHNFYYPIVHGGFPNGPAGDSPRSLMLIMDDCTSGTSCDYLWVKYLTETSPGGTWAAETLHHLPAAAGAATQNLDILWEDCGKVHLLFADTSCAIPVFHHWHRPAPGAAWLKEQFWFPDMGLSCWCCMFLVDGTLHYAITWHSRLYVFQDDDKRPVPVASTPGVAEGYLYVSEFRRGDDLHPIAVDFLVVSGRASVYAPGAPAPHYHIRLPLK